MTTLEQQLMHLPPGAHMCMIYTSREDQLRAVVPFFQEGIRRRDQCLFILDASRQQQMLADLESNGLEVQRALDEGSLCLQTARETYLRKGRFRPDAMIDFLLEAGEQAKSCGWSGLRATAEMTWALGTDVDPDELIEYEGRLNQLPQQSGLHLLCQYDQVSFSPHLIREVLRTHPWVILDGLLHENPYYQCLDGAVDSRDIENMLQNMQRRTRRALTLAELGSWVLERVSLTELMNAAAQIVARELGAPLVEIIELRADESVRRVASAGLHVNGPWEQQLDPRSVCLSAVDVGMDLTRLVPDWDREDRWRLRDELRSLGIRSSASVPIRTGEDQPIYGMLWVHSTEQRIFTDDDLAFVGTVAAVISQSVRRARIDQTFETVVETSPDVIVKFDRELRHTYGNVSMERVLGIRATELVGKTSREAGMPEPQVGNWELVLAQALRTGREQTTELGVRTRLGDRQFQARIVPEFGANGAPESLLAILRDVTDQRRAESERAELYRDVLAQRTRLSELMENLQAQHAGERDRAERAMLVGHLTPREREVLRLLVRGWTNREIAAELNVSRGTVKNHVARILTTLDASDRTQAAVRAVELGITVSD